LNLHAVFGYCEPRGTASDPTSMGATPFMVAFDFFFLRHSLRYSLPVAHTMGPNMSLSLAHAVYDACPNLHGSDESVTAWGCLGFRRNNYSEADGVCSPHRCDKKISFTVHYTVSYFIVLFFSTKWPAQLSTQSFLLLWGVEYNYLRPICNN